MNTNLNNIPLEIFLDYCTEQTNLEWNLEILTSIPINGYGNEFITELGDGTKHGNGVRYGYEYMYAYNTGNACGTGYQNGDSYVSNKQIPLLSLEYEH